MRFQESNIYPTEIYLFQVNNSNLNICWYGQKQIENSVIVQKQPPEMIYERLFLNISQYSQKNSVKVTFQLY